MYSCTCETTIISGFVCYHKKTRPRNRLFCFHHAGGAASSFFNLSLGLQESAVEVQCMQLPGREGRMSDDYVCLLPQVIEMLSHDISQMNDLPFAFCGNSFGGLIAFEVARKLRALSYKLPESIFVSACIPPHLVSTLDKYSRLSDSELLNKIKIEYQDSPSEVKSNMELMKMLLKRLRADFKIIDDYRYVEQLPLDIPLTIFGGVNDSSVSRDQLQQWSIHSRGLVNVEMVKGNHFFVYENPHLITTWLKKLDFA